MAKTKQLSIAHLVNHDPIRLHCGNLIEMLENGVGSGAVPLTLLDRRNRETHLSYEDLLQGARVVATYLKNRGLQRGDKVVIILMTGGLFINSFFGAILAGGVPVPASPPMTFGDVSRYLSNLRHIVKNSEARFMITFPRIRKVIGNVLADDNELKELILAKDITPEQSLNPGFPSIDGNDPAFFQYTSGTTSSPKGAVLTHRALLSNIFGIGRGLDCGPDDTGVSWLPLYHDMGLIGGVLTALYTRFHLVTMPPEAFMMNPSRWLQNVTRYRATMIVAPNFAYHLCANHITREGLAALDLSNLRIALNGAEPVDLNTLKIFEEKFAPAGFGDYANFPVYGMAENCLAVTFPRPGQRFDIESIDRRRLEVDGLAVNARKDDPSPYQAVSVGAPLAGQEVAVSGCNGRFARESEVGEVMVKSPSLMQGYYRNREQTAEAIKDGWLLTGDLGFIKNGRLFITGRAKEMIIKRGRNYYPYDIERAASTVAGVRKGCLAAFAARNPETGTEDLVVVAETRETDGRRKRQMERAVGAVVLSTIGIKPDKILLVPPRSIPKTSSGKLQRLQCRQRYNDGTLVKAVPERWLAPLIAIVGSFIGHQRFRLRARNS